MSTPRAMQAPVLPFVCRQRQWSHTYRPSHIHQNLTLPPATTYCRALYSTLQVYKPTRRWSPYTPEEDDKLISLRTSGQTYKAISVAMGRGRGTLSSRFQNLMRPATRTGKWSQKEDTALLQAHAAVASKRKQWLAEFARGIGHSPASAASRLRGIHPEYKRTPITDDEAQHIRTQVNTAKEQGSSIPWAAIARSLRRSTNQVWKFWVCTCGSTTLGAWSPHEDRVLREEVALAGTRPIWAQIGRMVNRMGGAVKCRWELLRARELNRKRGPDWWHKDEERELIQFANSFADGERILWKLTPLSKRSPEACRSKYMKLIQVKEPLDCFACD